MLLSFPVFPRDLQAWGNNFAATIIIAGTLVWHILHPSDADRAADAAGPGPQAALKANS
jgi:hypothetical protein